jgi:hypothetical protein
MTGYDAQAVQGINWRRTLLAFVIVATLCAAGAEAAAPALAAVLGGSHAVQGAVGRADAGAIVMFRFTGIRSGTAHGLRLYVDGSRHAGTVETGLYSNIRGRPGRLLSSGVLQRPVARKWNSLWLRSVRLTRGARYWIALLPRQGTLFFRDRPADGCRLAEAQTGAARSLPLRAGRMRLRHGCSLSAYITGEAGAPRPVGSAQGACFPAPGTCGFPDPSYHNVGARSSCSSLPGSGPIRDSTPGSTISNLNVKGSVTVNAPNVTIENVCVTTNGGGQLGSHAIVLESGAKNATISRVTVAGADQAGQSVEEAIANESDSIATVDGAYAYNCGECVWGGPWTINDSYVITNGMQGTGDHLEDLYCSDSSANLNHDVLLEPADQTATVFCDTHWGSGGPCDNHISIANSLLAGGGYILYTCGNSSSVGSSTMSINNNRFARCTTGPITFNRSIGGHACQGSTGSSMGSGADGHGYWPDGGYFGVDADTYCPPRSGQTWSGNVWDDNGAPVGC